MSAIAFDTLAYAKKLKKAGVPEEQAEVQAEALAEIVEERLSTKRDLKELEVELKRSIEEVRRDIKEMVMHLTIRLGGMLVVAVGVVAALVKLL